MKLLIVRHGETEENKRHILQGHLPGTLTGLGIAQAESLALQLEGMAFDVLLSSDLKRCMDTAEILNRHHGKAIIATPLLRERDWGSITGMVVDPLHPVVIPDDVESVEAMRQRARVFLDDVSATYPAKTVLAVSHGLFLRCLQAVHFSLALNEIEKMDNCEMRELSL